MSPRAACRLVSLGFGDVYDYVGSKMDWIGEDLPFEGTLASQPRLSALADPTVPTCALDDRAGDVRARLEGWEFVVVVSGPDRVVVGLAQADALVADDAKIADVMQEGPSTYRPHVTATEMAERLSAHPADAVLVTTLSGRLIGVAGPDAIVAAADL